MSEAEKQTERIISLFTKGVCSKCEELLFEYPIDAMKDNALGVSAMVKDGMDNHGCEAPIYFVDYDPITGKEVQDEAKT
jgi:hypothetical protein